ncbi:MAG: hypothetical protein Q9218_000898 [Villophora microphyllina]
MIIVPEDEIFRPVDLKAHPDDWPIYHLKNVDVVSQRTQESVSLLESNKDHAVQVTGMLEASQACRGLEKRRRSKRVKISNVSFWAFSEDPSLWASGKAGWFELHDPLPHYRNIFDGMNEAVSMLYYLADRYKRLRKSFSCSNFKEYAPPRGQQPVHSDAQAVVNSFRSHARFLITSMLEGQDDLDWHKSPFLQYFSYCFADIYEEIDSRLHPRKLPMQAKANYVVAQPHLKGNASCQKNDHRRDSRAKPKLPTTPEQSRLPVQTDVTSGDESCDSNGKLVKVGTKRKSRSILRPKGSKFSRKAASRRLGAPVVADQVDEASACSEEIASPQRSPLAAVTQQEPEYQNRLPRKFAEIKMVPYDIPSDQPQGPGDLWTCTFENCNHRVHAASETKGRAQIKEHFQQHARRAQEKIDLALAESRPYLPVSNLVRQIQLVQPSILCLSSPVTRRY